MSVIVLSCPGQLNTGIYRLSEVRIQYLPIPNGKPGDKGVLTKRGRLCLRNTRSSRNRLVVSSRDDLASICRRIFLSLRMQLLRQKLERGIRDPKRGFKHNVSALGHKE